MLTADPRSTEWVRSEQVAAACLPAGLSACFCVTTSVAVLAGERVRVPVLVCFHQGSANGACSFFPWQSGRTRSNRRREPHRRQGYTADTPANPWSTVKTVADRRQVQICKKLCTY